MSKENNCNIPQPIRGDKGATVTIPRNLERDRQNRICWCRRKTDHGTVDNMKFSFSDVHNRWKRADTRVSDRSRAADF
ncbi:hypothetical protein ABFY50_00700 [Bacillus amyloliquefaciens]